ncbi:hypothetical protein GCM10023088_62030 [Actinomadura verrucosospora]
MAGIVIDRRSPGASALHPDSFVPSASYGGEPEESPYSPQAGDGLQRAGLALPSPGVVQATMRPVLEGPGTSGAIQIAPEREAHGDGRFGQGEVIR